MPYIAHEIAKKIEEEMEYPVKLRLISSVKADTQMLQNSKNNYYNRVAVR